MRLAALVAIATLSLSLRPAAADPCGMVPPIQIATGGGIERVGLQKTYVAHDGGIETMVLRPGFQGDVDEFGMLIPFPSPPTVRKVDDNIFGHIAAAIDPPEVVARVVQWQSRGRFSRAKADMATSAPASAGGYESGLRIDEVRVVRQEAVGMYEVAVLAAGGAKALKKWMDDNQFRYPEGMDEVVEDYVASRWFFVAIKTRVGSKAGVNPVPGMRSVNAAKPAGASFNGFVQAMGFRFKSKDLVIPMRLSVFNAEGDQRNIVYVLTDKPTRLQNLPKGYVKRQIDGLRLYRNVTDPLPLRVIGGTKADLNASQLAQIEVSRQPEPHSGLARELFGADLLAMQSKRLTSTLEEQEKAVLNIGEELGLRGPSIDDLNRSLLHKVRGQEVERALKRLRSMTMTVIDGDFDHKLLAKQNLRVTRFAMAAKQNHKSSYDATRAGPAPQMGGKLYLWQLSDAGGVDVEHLEHPGQAPRPRFFSLGAALASTNQATNPERVALDDEDRKLVGVAGAVGGGTGTGGVAVLMLGGLLLVLARRRRWVSAVAACALFLMSADTPMAHAKGASVATAWSYAGTDGQAKARELAGSTEGAKSLLSHLRAKGSAPEAVISRGHALIALTEVASSLDGKVQSALQAIHGDDSEPMLLRTWAMAARIRLARNLGELQAMRATPTQPFYTAYDAWAKRAEELLSNKGLADKFDFVAREPGMMQRLQPEFLAASSSKLLDVMLTAGEVQGRAYAASYLGARPKEETIPELTRRLRFRPKASDAPWGQGALYFPSVSLSKEEALPIAESMLAWLLWAEAKQMPQTMNVVINNFASGQLTSPLGLRLDDMQKLRKGSAYWLTIWERDLGEKSLRRVLRSVGRKPPAKARFSQPPPLR